MQTATAAEPIRFQSRARRLQGRALGFATLVALAALLVGATVFGIVEVYIPASELLDESQNALKNVSCDDQSCDISKLANDFYFVGAEYLIDKKRNFLLNFDPPQGFRSPLSRSDVSFVAQFHEPQTYSSPARETWRLLSAERTVGAHPLAVLVGYAVNVSWRLYLPLTDFGEVDQQMRNQLAKITDGIREKNGELEIPDMLLPNDGYEIVDEQSGEILSGGYWLPVFLPSEIVYPTQGISFHLGKRNLYLTRTTETGRLIAMSIYRVGELPFLILMFVLLSVIAGLAGYVFAMTVLRSYLLFRETAPLALEDALKYGEGPAVEFKRAVSLEGTSAANQVLQTVAAFANTGDGSVFIGVEDDGKVKGLPLENQKAKDSFSHRISQKIRDCIKPIPVTRVDFLEAGGCTVCRLFVPRGDDPLYYLEGTIYVRYGSADIKAQPELVDRILKAYHR